MPEPDLTDLDAFVAVARARSFRGAARLRGVLPSALSEAMRRLEARLGSRLVNRTTRSVTPTDAGKRLLERLSPAMQEIGSALAEVPQAADAVAGTLRLNAPTVVAHHVLPSIVGRFLAAHPGIVMEIENNDSFIDVLAEGFDAGIRYEERIERDMVAILIGPKRQRYVLACSPAYLAKHGTPRHPRDLLAHACIRHRFASRVVVQRELEKEGETVRVAAPRPLVASSAELKAEAAIAGLGLICTLEEYLAPALQPAPWCHCSRIGCRRSRGRDSTTPSAGTCRRLCARSSISARRKAPGPCRDRGRAHRHDPIPVRRLW